MAAGRLIAAKVWRFTILKRRYSSTNVVQIGSVIPAIRGTQLNPYTDGSVAFSAVDGRVLTGTGHLNGAYTSPARIARYDSTSGGVIIAESAAMLVDTSLNIMATGTKWCFYWAPGNTAYAAPYAAPYLVWEWPRLVKCDSIYIANGNDDNGYPERQPVWWRLDAYLPARRGWYTVCEQRDEWGYSPPTGASQVHGPYYFTKFTPCAP